MFNNLSGVELFYLVCGVVGGGLFLLRSIMIFAGLGGDDAAGDMHDGSIGDETTADFKMVSVHGITAFLLMFGLVGILMMRGGKGAAAGADRANRGTHANPRTAAMAQRTNFM